MIVKSFILGFYSVILFVCLVPFVIFCAFPIMIVYGYLAIDEKWRSKV